MHLKKGMCCFYEVAASLRVPHGLHILRAPHVLQIMPATATHLS